MNKLLALHGGKPVRESLLSYGGAEISQEDIDAVTSVLRSAYLTTGPRVEEFEKAFADYVGVEHAISFSNGTAALHGMLTSLGIGLGDEVIVPAITFVATANSALFCGATPVFADVMSTNLLIDPKSVEQRITQATKAILCVDFAGQPCDYDALKEIANKHSLILLADACHALGGSWKGCRVGAIAESSAFSFHPVKPITTGEGGMVTTNCAEQAERLRRFRSHGIALDYRTRQEKRSYHYDMESLGYNYRLTDMQSALGISQLRRLPAMLEKRQTLARRYDELLAEFPFVSPLEVCDRCEHAYHLYVVKVDWASLGITRDEAFAILFAEGIGVNVHYQPVMKHSFYQALKLPSSDLCPVAEEVYEELLTLPLSVTMKDEDVDDVVSALRKLAATYA